MTERSEPPAIPQERSTIAAKLILSMVYLVLILSFSMVSKAWASEPGTQIQTVIPKVQTVIPKVQTVIPKVNGVIPKSQDLVFSADYLSCEQLGVVTS